MLAIGLGGCGGSGSLTGTLPTAFEAPTLALPKFSPPEPKAPAGSITPIEPIGSGSEIYSRIARGAVQCWFGASGPFKKDYVYHAEADAPSRGGKAEITMHVRDPSQPNPRGPKAYRIKIEPVGETALVNAENLRLPEPTALALNADVGRWAKGEIGCTGANAAAAWSPSKEAPASGSDASNRKAKSKAKTAAKSPTR